MPESVKSEQTLDSGLEWSDETGDNLLVFDVEKTVDWRKDKREKLTDVVLTATHWQKPSEGEWGEVRTFKERVDQCPWDAGISPMVGDWSLTDLDDDSVKEVMFAYSAGCRSSMNTITHKVIVFEDGEKSVLRGQTVVALPDEEKQVGDMEEAAGFEGEQKAFRDHAEEVWKKTSNERLAIKYEL